MARHSPRGPVAPSPVALATRSFSTSIIARQEQASTAEEEQQRELDDGEKNIVEILTREFQPAQLQVQDVSGEWVGGPLVPPYRLGSGRGRRCTAQCTQP